MTLSLLGASCGTIIKGNHCYNNDLVIQLHSDVPPWSGYENSNLQNYEIIRLARRFRSDFFSDMTDEEIIEWIEVNKQPGEGSGNKNLPDDTMVEILESAGEKSKLPPSIIHGIMTVGEIQNILDKPTLSFNYFAWDIVIADYEINPNDIIGQKVVTDGNIIIMNEVIPDHKYYRILIKGEVLNLAGHHSNDNYIKDILVEMNLVKEYELLKSCTSYYTPAGYKSLLQKVIRIRPETVKMVNENGEHLMSASDVSILTFVMLYESKGSFVPDLGKFVSGRESALKRLAVSIMEDSFVDDIREISILMNDAMIMQMDKKYNITKDRFKQCMKIAGDAAKESRYYSYSTDKIVNLMYKDVRNIQDLATYLLGVIGSFKSDVSLFYTAQVEPSGIKGQEPIIDMYDIYRAIDHHWMPNFVYTLNLDLVRSMAKNDGEPLSSIMHYIWDYSSGYNTRRKNPPPLDKWNLIGKSQQICNLYNLGLYDIVSRGRKIVDGTYETEYKLSEGYVAVKVGLHYKGKAMICVNADNIQRISTSIIPSRDSGKNKSSYLDPVLEEQSINYFKGKLRSGINGVVLDDGVYTINGRCLEDFLTVKIKADLFKYNGEITFSYDPTSNKDLSEHDSLTVIQTKNSDVGRPQIVTESPAANLWCSNMTLEKIFGKFEKNEINRAKYHIMIGGDYITMPSISRNGGGVSKYDVGAYQLLNMVSIYYPLAIRQEKIGKFKVTPMLKILFDSVKTGGNYISTPKILPFDRDNRIPYEHQTTTIVELDKRPNNFIWIPVGMGKTYIVIAYIVKLLSEGRMCNYLLYTLPAEAMLNVELEFNKWGIKINVIKPLKGYGWNYLKFYNDGQYVVNLINHDHLRKINFMLEEYMEDTFYVVDEVHKTLAETQRSNVAQTLAALSHRFIVMTGTPVINTKMSMLIGWLKMTVDYPINKNNFWLAVSSMISKQVTTGVKVIKTEIYTPMNIEERLMFNQFVGPNLGGINSKVNMADITMAMNVAYKATDRKMIEIIVENINEGVFVVSRNKEHQEKLYDMLIDAGISSRKIGLMSKDNLFNLINKEDKGPSIVITTVSLNAGYTLTKLGVLVTSVYFSNLAVREQLEGRINRITQKREIIYNYVVFTDLLDLVLKNYNHVSGIAGMVKMLSE